MLWTFQTQRTETSEQLELPLDRSKWVNHNIDMMNNGHCIASKAKMREATQGLVYGMARTGVDDQDCCCLQCTPLYALANLLVGLLTPCFAQLNICVCLCCRWFTRKNRQMRLIRFLLSGCLPQIQLQARIYMFVPLSTVQTKTYIQQNKLI